MPSLEAGASELQNGVLQQVKLPSGFSDENFVALLSNQGQQRRRRFPNGGSSGRLTRRHSLREDVEHAAAETYLITRLTFKLLRYLGIGYRWIVKFMALGFYALFLMPGFLQIGWYYFFSGKVHRSIEYGDQPRNRLDLYIPEKVDKPLPAVAFVTGGAWIIGYKAWGSLLGQQLVDRDIIVACIDYRNFPQGRIGDMVKDVTTGISFFCNTIAEYGGDPDRLYLAGQSAGAHISTCALLEQARKEALEGPQSVTWSASQFKCFFGLSGGYNLPELIDHFHRRGLYRSIFLSVMEGEDSLEKYSPEMVVQSSEFRTAVPLLPPLVLFHGTADYSIPYDESVIFADALQSVNAKVSVKLYDDKTHTDLILQDPMRGGRDELLADILEVIHADEEEELAIDRSIKRPRMVPEILLQLARKVSPF